MKQMDKRLSKKLIPLVIASTLAIFSVSISLSTSLAWFSNNHQVSSQGLSLSSVVGDYARFGDTFKVTRSSTNETTEYYVSNNQLVGFSLSGILPSEIMKIDVPIRKINGTEFSYTLTLSDFYVGNYDDPYEINGWFDVTDDEGNLTHHNVLGVYRVRPVSYTIGDETTSIKAEWKWLGEYNALRDDIVLDSVELYTGTTSAQLTYLTFEIQFNLAQFASTFSISTNVLSLKSLSIHNLNLSSKEVSP